VQFDRERNVGIDMYMVRIIIKTGERDSSLDDSLRMTQRWQRE
jgi:hypothetical protein